MSFVFAAQKAETSRRYCVDCVSMDASVISRLVLIGAYLRFACSCHTLLAASETAMLTVTNGRWSKTGN